MKVYAARDKNTGKFVSNITSRSKKFWERKNACMEAISKYNRYSWKKYDLEVAELVCVDANEYANLNKLIELYIKETSCDGQLFCGSRYDDCENFRSEECRKCLLEYLNNLVAKD